MKQFPSFKTAIEMTTKEMLMRSRAVMRGKWQGVDVSKRPEMTANELLHCDMCVPMISEDLEFYRKQVNPNLPWADNHFLERVGGKPINPGVEWANWPWGKNADKFRTIAPGPMVPVQDWAYLASLIDYQKPLMADAIEFGGDDTMLQWVAKTFKVGTKATGRAYLVINKPSEVQWILHNVTPHLKTKRAKADAEEMLADFEDHEDDDKLWGQEWEPRFDHNYMTRYWPKVMENGSIMRGHMFDYGDLSDVVEELHQDPTTRQAILPVFFPEDTGYRPGRRKPCSLFYQFLLDGTTLDIVYYLRSCDLIRHFRDDIYLTVRLNLWMLDTLREREKFWYTVKPGKFVMLIGNLHCFANDMINLRRANEP